MSHTRYFVVEADRVFIPPKGLLAGPGGTARIFKAGELVELAKVDRFVRGRKQAGDLRELKESEASAYKAKLASSPPATTAKGA
jgi:hypothetical protein